MVTVGEALYFDSSDAVCHLLREVRNCLSSLGLIFNVILSHLMLFPLEA